MDDLELTLADELRDAYILWRRRTHGNYRPHDRNNPDFLKAGDLCRKMTADPRVFIEAQFSIGVWGDNHCPYPNQLASAQAEQNYLVFINRDGYKPQPEAALGVQFRYLANFTQRVKKSVDEALVLPSISDVFTHYFRILACSEAKLPAFLEVCGEKARAEIRAVPGLYEHLMQKYEYRTKRLFPSPVPGQAAGACSPPPPAAVPGRQREI